MCGIVGAVAERDVTPILLEGLHRLEYRGYDSSGIVVLNGSTLSRVRRKGKVHLLEAAVQEKAVNGTLGIAHTRWATHGEPSQANAHPHMSGTDLAVVHNGIIENFESLRAELKSKGYEFSSQTDTEVIVHLIHSLHKDCSLKEAVSSAVEKLDGAYALGVIEKSSSDHFVCVRSGSPLVLGLGLGENYIASDQLALLPVTNRFIFLDEGDMAVVTRESVDIWNEQGDKVNRETHEFDTAHEDAEKGEYRHYMQKEIFEQPLAIQKTMEGRIENDTVSLDAFSPLAEKVFPKIKGVQIVACGTSYHAGLIAKYWCEGIAGLPCHIEVASEFRYRETFTSKDTLFVTISQSGETADTLAALRKAKKVGYVSTLVICNVPGSSLVRESDMAFMTQAGPEIGVASTKAFTTQLVGLLLLVLALARNSESDRSREKQVIAQLRKLPSLVEQVLLLDKEIETLAEHFGEKNHTLFLGRGTQYPVAMEGALKLKEISYIHAEAYPAGELKHGPLALVDKEMPVVAVAPNNELLEKLKSNLQEVKARGGELFLFADKNAGVQEEAAVHVVNVPHIDDVIAPLLYTVPLQLLSYHVALIKGTDVDQPRNLAKSVTVE